MKHRFWVGVYGVVEYGCKARQPAEEEGWRRRKWRKRRATKWS
jgi:hypothetical protein